MKYDDKYNYTVISKTSLPHFFFHAYANFIHYFLKFWNIEVNLHLRANPFYSLLNTEPYLCSYIPIYYMFPIYYKFCLTNSTNTSCMACAANKLTAINNSTVKSYHHFTIIVISTPTS